MLLSLCKGLAATREVYIILRDTLLLPRSIAVQYQNHAMASHVLSTDLGNLLFCTRHANQPIAP